MNKFKKALKNTNILGEIRFKSPKQHEPTKSKEKAATWAREILQKVQD